MNERFGIVANARNAWPSADELDRLGVRWVRSIVYSFDELDAALRNHPPGVNVIALLNGENEAVRSDLSGWRGAIEEFARRFAGRVQAVECLNEWDLARLPASVAAECARTAAPFLVDAGIGCLLGSVAGPRWQESLEEVVGLLSPEDRIRIAGASFHPYGKSARGFPPGFIFGEIDQAVMRAHELTGMPIYLTEFGIKIADAGGEPGQAAYFRQAYEVLRELPSEVLAAACYFCWSDQIGGPEEQGPNAFGLRRADGTGRESFELCCALAESAAMAFEPDGQTPAEARDQWLAGSTRVKIFGHDGPYSLGELQIAAYRLAEWAPARPIAVIPEAALFRYWLEHKEVGTAATSELPVADTDGGGTAIITMAGHVLRWTGGDRVEVT
ncbi:MAG: hypothetical protein IT307_19920 [Chloroflexi bacterium]|nr:hypothetical protein [Chloroflexota bacterium]